jgi:hypothetical protein
MRRNLLLTSIGGVAALALFGASAVAAPGHLGAQSSASLVTLAHHGGGSMGMHFSGASGPRMHFRSVGARYSSGPTFHSHNFPHEHHHHHRRFFVAGVPYYDYDYSYDNSNCWWSRRFHHWVCPSY